MDQQNRKEEDMKDIMNTQEEKFVLHNYRHDKLDTVRALQKVKAMTGHSKTVSMWRRMAVAASLLALVAAGTMFYMTSATTTLVAEAKTQTFTLDDGTRVTLSPHSTLTYKDSNCREVEITGKAYFDIAHDADRPFSIRDQDYIVNDIGTKFVVDETASGTTVYVTEGIVYFASAQNKTQGLTLHKDDAALLARNGSRPEAIENPSANMATWATGMFHFNNTPLSEVLSNLSAHYGVQLSCTDKTSKLTGDFDSDDLQEIISIIEKTLNVRISRIP